MDPAELLRFACPACGEENTLEVELEDGDAQEFVVDCWVCCRPARVRLQRRGAGGFEVTVDSANE